MAENEGMKRMMSVMGISDKYTREYFETLLIEQRVIGAVYPDTKFNLWGETFETPIMMTALSHLHYKRGDVESNGMVEQAEGALAAGAVNWVGMDENDELGEILDTGAKTIKIMKTYADDDEIYSRLEFCEKHGAFAVGMDVDHATGITDAEEMTVLGKKMQQKTMAQLKEYVSATRLPFVVKGVLSVQDAVRSAEIGAKAILISHHHGIMPYSVPPIMVLPKIRQAVGNSLKIFVDCGIMNGLDAFKALALGADAVGVGRAIMPILKEGGASALTTAIRQMNEQLRGIMIRTDSKDLDHIDPSVIWPVSWHVPERN